MRIVQHLHNPVIPHLADLIGLEAVGVCAALEKRGVQVIVPSWNGLAEFRLRFSDSLGETLVALLRLLVLNLFLLVAHSLESAVYFSRAVRQPDVFGRVIFRERVPVHVRQLWRRGLNDGLVQRRERRHVSGALLLYGGLRHGLDLLTVLGEFLLL